MDTCATPGHVADPQRFGVVTTFTSEVGLDVIDELNISLAYANITGQLNDGSERRNILYSPDARVAMTVSLSLDKVYQAATATAAGPAPTRVAVANTPSAH